MYEATRIFPGGFQHELEEHEVSYGQKLRIPGETQVGLDKTRADSAGQGRDLSRRLWLHCRLLHRSRKYGAQVAARYWDDRDERGCDFGFQVDKVAQTVYEGAFAARTQTTCGGQMMRVGVGIDGEYFVVGFGFESGSAQMVDLDRR